MESFEDVKPDISQSKSLEEASVYGSFQSKDDIAFPATEIEKQIEDEHFDDFKTHVEILVELGKEKLKPLELTDCYTSDRPGLYLEILPKIIFEAVESENNEEVDFPKPIFRLTFDQGTIATTEYDSSVAQTLRSKLLNSWNQYEPRLYPEEKCDEIANTEPFNEFLQEAEKGIAECLIQNKSADSFVHELQTLHTEKRHVETSKETALVLRGSFVCFEGNEKQIIKSVNWHPVLKDIFVVSALYKMKFEERTMNLLAARSESHKFYVWSCNNQFMPKIYLEHFDDIIFHKFNPSIPNIVVGGGLSGQLILWNLEPEKLSTKLSTDKNLQYFMESNSPNSINCSAVSNPDHNHARGITDLMWIPNHLEILPRGTVKMSTASDFCQIATCGLDGILKFWDLRPASQSKPGLGLSKMYRYLDGKWEPFHSVDLYMEEGKKYLPVTKFTLREPFKNVISDEKPTDENKTTNGKVQISTELYGGCEDGEIFCANFKLYRDDAGKFRSYPPVLYNSPHSGTITAIALSPFVRDIFLSTGSRTIAIWKHNVKTLPIYSKDMHAYITSAQWSNTRPAVFALGYEDGSIELWDLLHNVYEPFCIHYVSTASVNALSFQTVTEEECVVGVGDAEGIAYLLSLPPCLWKPVDNETNLMESFVEKESKRIESNLITAKSSKSTTEETKEEAEIKITVGDDITDELLDKNYEEFLELQQIQLRHLGLIEEKIIEKEEEISEQTE